MKNRMATLLMETGQEYNKKKLHGAKYFRELLEKIQDVPESFKEILQMSRGALELFESCQKRLLKELVNNEVLRGNPEIRGHHTGFLLL